MGTPERDWFAALQREERRRRVLQVVAWTVVFVVLMAVWVVIFTVAANIGNLATILSNTDVQQWIAIGVIGTIALFMFFFPDRWDD